MRKIAGLSFVGSLVLLTLSALSTAAQTPREPLATTLTTPTTIDWQLRSPHDGGKLTIAGPAGMLVERSFGSGENPSFTLADSARVLPDGFYAWQLSASPRLDAEARAALGRARASNLEGGDLTESAYRQSGHFAIANGLIVAADAIETTAQKTAEPTPTPKDFVIADDLIVQFSACVGLDCVDGESFGFDTLRLKENNTRIKFEDTSTGSFPAHDWQLTANDSASGGAEKFSIEDITAATVPFTIAGSAPSNSIFVDSSGRLGLGTAAPVLDVHVLSGNTPALRLEQDGSSGFTPYTWDVAGNEAGYFVRDVTGGSRLPFRILPGAASNALTIASNSNVGVGTLSPASTLHVSGSAGTTAVRISETSATTQLRTLLDLRNNGDVQFILRNTNSGENWQLLAFNNGFQISEVSTTNVFSFLEGGNMQIPGMYTSTSDRNAKENVEAVDPQQVLDKVLRLPIATWNFKTQDAALRHMGPMAQDFYALFGLGDDDKTIGLADPSGVALAAIQGLYQNLQDLRQENAELKARLERLEAAQP